MLTPRQSPETELTAEAATQGGSPRRCSSCDQTASLFLCADNGNDYCFGCARELRPRPSPVPAHVVGASAFFVGHGAGCNAVDVDRGAGTFTVAAHRRLMSTAHVVIGRAGARLRAAATTTTLADSAQGDGRCRSA